MTATPSAGDRVRLPDRAEPLTVERVRDRHPPVDLDLVSPRGTPFVGVLWRNESTADVLEIQRVVEDGPRPRAVEHTEWTVEHD